MLRGDDIWVDVRGVKGVACIKLIVRGVRNSTLSRRVWPAEIGFFETACTRRKVWDVGLGVYRAACMRRQRHHPPTPSRTLPPTSRRGTPPRARSLFETTQISAFAGFVGWIWSILARKTLAGGGIASSKDLDAMSVFESDAINTFRVPLSEARVELVCADDGVVLPR